jgi:hypothetical protein
MYGKEKRKFQRITTLMPFEVRKVDTQELESCSLQCQVSKGAIVLDDSTPPQVKDECLNQWLYMLNTKLDYLISHSVSRQNSSIFMEVEPLNISGNGMSIITKKGFNVGDILEMRVIIQTYPAKILHLYGKVVRAEGTPNRPASRTLGISFLDTNEEVQNEILKFDFKKHKEKLIKKKQ